MNKSIFALSLIPILMIAVMAVPVYANDATVTVSLTNTKTGDVIWVETFTVADGIYTVEVPEPLLNLIEKAFGITVFGPGTHTADVGANTLTIEVFGDLTVTFVKRPWGEPLPAKEVELVKKVSLRGPKAAGGKPTAPAATGDLGTLCTGKKYAIVVGISDYPGTGNDLLYADDDALEMKAALTSVYGYQETNIIYLVDVSATRSAIMSAIADIKAKAKSGDEVVFFFSGHGAKGKAADGDRETVDESIVCHEDGQTAYIWDGELKLAFAGFATTRIVFAFDSCLAGGMTDLKATGRVIAMATTETGVGYEDAAWQNGQFTYYFVDKGMIYGLADRYDNIPSVPDVTVEEAFDYAKTNCTSQSPTISDSFTSDMLL